VTGNKNNSAPFQAVKSLLISVQFAGDAMNTKAPTSTAIHSFW
jgi:hypothetical protein